MALEAHLVFLPGIHPAPFKSFCAGACHVPDVSWQTLEQSSPAQVKFSFFHFRRECLDPLGVAGQGSLVQDLPNFGWCLPLKTMHLRRISRSQPHSQQTPGPFANSGCEGYRKTLQ